MDQNLFSLIGTLFPFTFFPRVMQPFAFKLNSSIEIFCGCTLGSLKSLPTATANQHSEGWDPCLDLALVNKAAERLSKRLGLTIFGFDVVVSSLNKLCLHISYVKTIIFLLNLFQCILI